MTHRDLAKQLNISPAALSLIINGKPGISDKTRERVLNQLKELGMTELIKAHASSRSFLNHNESKSICFVVYKRNGEVLDRSPFFLFIIEGVENEARKNGYGTMFFTIDKRNDLPSQIKTLQSIGCEGVIVFATEMFEDDIEIFSALPFPCVFIDNLFIHSSVDSVAIDNEFGTYQAVNYLFNCGHRKIGYLKSSNYINSFNQRYSGFISALNSLQIPFDSRFVVEVDYSEGGSYHNFKRILQAGFSLPTAFLADSDTIAAGVGRALLEKGYKLPQDVSIIGFDDRPLCVEFVPAITTIRIPKYSFGAAAVDLLVKRINEKHTQQIVTHHYKNLIGTELVIRESVKII